MEAIKEKIELEDYELEFLIDVLKHDKINSQWSLDSKELEEVFKLYNEVIDKLILLLTINKNEKEINK